MITIYKYGIPEERIFKISMPANAKILALQTQRGDPQIWVLVGTDNKMEERTFSIYGTGSEIENSYNQSYIGTFQQFGGTLIWHVFETTLPY